MSKIILDFQIKRGVVERDNVDEESIEIYDRCIELCKNGKHEDAARELRPYLYFEWNWDNCDGNPSDDFITSQSINFICNEDNSSIRIGQNKGNLIITAEVQFEVFSVRDINAETIQDWIDDKSLWSCGFISAGWSYSESDGDNVWLISIDGQPV